MVQVGKPDLLKVFKEVLVMKILVINSGSSSIKYQFIGMDGEKVLCKGIAERIGISGSRLIHKIGSENIFWKRICLIMKLH